MRSAACLPARPAIASAPKYILRLPVESGMLEFPGESTAPAATEALFARLPFDWQRELLLNWIDHGALGVVLDMAIARAPKGGHGPVLIEPFRAEHRTIFRSTVADADGPPGYMLGWRDNTCLEFVWKGEVTRAAMRTPNFELASAYYWGMLPMALRPELAQQGWTPESFHELVDEAQMDANALGGVYSLATVSLEFMYSQNPRTPGKIHIVITPSAEDENEDLSRFDPQRKAVAS